MPCLDKVYVVGHLPRGLTGIQHIPADDPYSNPVANTNHKVLVAAGAIQDEDSVLLCNDDFWLTATWDSDYCYYDSTLQVRLDENRASGDNYYRRALTRTRDWLAAMDGIGEALNFELHCPMPVRLEEVRKHIQESAEPLLPRSVLGNLGTFPCEPRQDHKIHRQWKSPPSWVRCVSADDHAIHSQYAKRWFSTKYPNMCRFETEEIVL